MQRFFPALNLSGIRRRPALCQHHLISRSHRHFVEYICVPHKQLAINKGKHERTMLQRQIEATDRQIDALVYELNGLTEEEIWIVEAAAK